MKYYVREVTRREVVNKFGKIGYVLHKEVIKTNDVEKFNKGKRIKFKVTDDKEVIKRLRKLEKDVVHVID